MDALSVLAIASQCVMAAPPDVVAAMAIAETDGSVYALQIGEKLSHNQNMDDAVQSAAIGLLNGEPVKVGIAGISTVEFDKRNRAYTDGFSPCKNLKIAGELLRESWSRFGSQEQHWRLAVLDFATGEAGAESEFSKKFDHSLTELQKIAATFPSSSQSPARAETATVKPKVQEQNPAQPPASLVDKESKNWDVFNRDSSQSLLVYSK